MKASKMMIATLKEAPQEAQISSHILLIRAGMIRKLVAGVYNYLPLGLRVLHKIENIIREEMDESGAQEILSSAIQPKELWEESGRWAKYGPELMRFKDRHQREFCLGPTHEEIFTDLVKNEIKSYKALPINLYQIQTKYRDELRPRFGLIRGREFIMKDAYSFDVDEKGLDVSYKNMYQTYSNIFTRLHINYQVVEADTGAIGGSESHQFMALSDIGESNIIYCDCGYAADEEKATTLDDTYKNDEEELELEEVETIDKKTIEEVANYLNVSKKDIAKAVVYSVSNKPSLFLIRGDREVNFIKVCNALNAAEHEVYLSTREEIEKYGSVEGFIGPINSKMDVYVDSELAKMKNMIVGANKTNMHIKNVNINRDFKAYKIVDLKDVSENMPCPICKKPLKKERGIEIGQIFKLKTKYSSAMSCTYLNEKGVEVPMVMGCYGIGVSRTMSAIIEQNHDENGIIWPLNVAPYHAVIIPVNYKDENQKKLADEIYETLKANKVEVILDDRDAKPGFKFKDFDLIGIPLIIVVGKRASEGIVEYKTRKENVKEEIDYNVAITRVIDKVNKEA
ncbi:MAG: proline--tRNA ligase [Erysipelotrichaceae bacterium]|nr:proline--tRNA ligase [Erysipelotrichaceae bacterium]